MFTVWKASPCQRSQHNCITRLHTFESIVFIYLSIFLAIAFAGLTVKIKRQEDWALGIFGVFLLIFMGTRYETGCDYGTYEARFNTLYHYTDYTVYLEREEPGFHVLNRLVHDLGLDFMWLNVFSALIFLFGLIRFVRLSPSPVLLLALFFPVIMVQLGMSGIRQAIALSFLLNALYSFVAGQRFQTAIWILIGAQFHQSTYLFLPLAMMAGQKFSWKLAMASVAFIGPAAYYFLGERAEIYANRYIDQIYGENASGGALLRYALALTPCLIFEYHNKRIQNLTPTLYPLLRTFSILTISIAPLAFISTVALHRMTYYMLPVTLLIFVCTVMAMPRPHILSRHWLPIPAITMAVYLIAWFSSSRHAAVCYVPYESFLLQ
jgi:hypothetical protein